MARSSETTEWRTKTLDRGTGCVCPRDECQGKVIVDAEQLAEDTKVKRVRSMVCPYCECVSLLPKGLR